ncbi:enoyl-CoA hydratase/isomerase family protein [Neolewinella sp.]|uniref:enoyl-CoA hydratase/isomerase family protein n=1 Tax=Neolewinella sp. TaxID=2993543 RepID=UPI003B52484D
MDYENLLLDQQDGILTITLNRPQALNAINTKTLHELHSFFSSDYRGQDRFHGIILTGAGDRAFVAGADIKEFLGIAEDGNGAAMAHRGHEILFQIERFHVPVIALINGFALGGGCELAMACHLRIATEQAKFGQPEVNLGIIPGYGGTQRLNQYIGKGKATELILTGNMIDAQEAYRLGLVNHVLPTKEEARVKAVELLTTIGRKGPVAIRESIRAINAYYANPEAFATEAGAFGTVTMTEDFKEGAAAFVEKRPAVFRGS